VAVVVEIVEIREAILAADRQALGKPPLDTTAEADAVGAEVVAVAEDVILAAIMPKPEVGVDIGPGPTDQAEDQQILGGREAGTTIDVD